MKKEPSDHDNDIVVTPVGVLNYHRLYERYLFFYVLILSVLLFFGARLFSLKMDGFSPVENLALHFISYVFVVGLMAFTPLWYALFLEWLPGTDRIWREIRRALKSIPDNENRAAAARILRANGEWPPTVRQTAALIVIFAVLLWEICFLSCWVGADGALVWQPDWVQAVWQWTEQHTASRYSDGKFFIFILRQETIDQMAAQGYRQVGQPDFLSSPLWHTVLFFHAWRAATYPLVLLCSGVVLWRSLDWLGMERLNPRNIRSVGMFIWCSIISLLMILFLFIFSFIIQGVSTTTLPSIVPKLWVANLKMYIGCGIFFLCSIKFFWGWLQFWKRIFRF